MSSSDEWFAKEAHRRIALDEANIRLFATAPEKEFELKGVIQITEAVRSADTAAVDKVLSNLRQRAMDQGANGVIGVRIEHSHSDQLQSFFITAYGDAVLFRDAG